MGCESAGDVQRKSETELVARFGEKAGKYVWQAVRGFHDEPGQHISTNSVLTINDVLVNRDPVKKLP